MRGRDPLLLSAYDFSDAVRYILSIESSYDLIWAWGPLGGHAVRIAAPSKGIVDFADVPHEVHQQHLERRPPPRRLPISPRDFVDRIARADIDRWRRFEELLERECLAVSVCSERERQEFAHGRAWVIPNGYSNVDPLGRVQVGEAPRMLFAGSAHWPPNVEGARLLVDEIYPRITKHLPHAQLVLTGSYDFLQGRDGVEGVNVLGYVPEIESVLSTADLIVVPLRSGTGTRLKVLEGWAHRIPVVSTSKGAEGLDARNDVHLLVADDPDDFSAACIRALTDVGLRQRLADNAYQHFRERYSWDVVGTLLGQMISELIRMAPTSAPK